MKYLRIIVPVLAAVFLFLFNIAFPASAALDYNDYITDISVDGDNDLVSISIPREYFRIQVRHDGSTVGLSNSNGILSVDMIGMEVYSILFQLNSDGRLFVDNIPNGAECTFKADIGRDQGAPYASPSTSAIWNFYDSNNKYISQQTVSFGKDTLTIGKNEPVVFELKKPTGAVVGAPGLTLSGFSPVQDATYIFKWETFEMKFSISSLYRLQEETGKTNKILTRVENELIKQGTTLDAVLEKNIEIKDSLDQIISGSDSQHAAADKFDNEVNQVVGELEDIGSQMDEVPRETIDVSQLVPTQILQGTHFLTYVDALNNFWDSPEIAIIVVTLGGMILISYLLFGEKG